MEKKRDIERLSEALENKDAEVRFKAIGALGRLKTVAPLDEFAAEFEQMNTPK